jgi:hypothetical membrane protein
VRRITWVSATAAPIALIGGWTLAATRQPEVYDAGRDTISALAAHGADDRWLMTAALAVVGGCHVVTAYGLEEAAPLGRTLLALGGVATGLVAVFAEPSEAHFPVATASFVLLAVWPAASGVPTPRAGWVAAGAMSALLAWFGTELGGERVGFVERVAAGAEALWPLAAVAATAAGLRRSRRRGA